MKQHTIPFTQIILFDGAVKIHTLEERVGWDCRQTAYQSQQVNID